MINIKKIKGFRLISEIASVKLSFLSFSFIFRVKRNKENDPCKSPLHILKQCPGVFTPFFQMEPRSPLLEWTTRTVIVKFSPSYLEGQDFQTVFALQPLTTAWIPQRSPRPSWRHVALCSQYSGRCLYYLERARDSSNSPGSRMGQLFSETRDFMQPRLANISPHQEGKLSHSNAFRGPNLAHTVYLGSQLNVDRQDLNSDSWPHLTCSPILSSRQGGSSRQVDLGFITASLQSEPQHRCDTDLERQKHTQTHTHSHMHQSLTH